MLGDAARHLKQNAVNLRLFLIQQAHQLIVLLDGFQRFHKDGLPARTGAVHHALHAPFLFHLHRNHKALAPDGHQLILNRATLRQAAKITAQRFLNRSALLFDLAANPCELR